MIQNYTDEQIIKAIQGSIESREKMFDYLYISDEWRDKAFSIIRGYIKDEERQEDIFTDSLLIFVKKIQRNFSKTSSLTTFLVSICKFKSLQYLQKQRRKPKLVESNQNKISDNSEEAPLLEAEVLRLIETRYDVHLKRRIAAQLSEKCLQYFRQRFWEDMSNKEIASAGNINEQSVKNTLSRCYAKMRELIKNDAEVISQIKLNYGKFL